MQKWQDVRDAVRKARQRDSDDRAFIVVNGDESEPGTFKDRELLLRTPHLDLEARDPRRASSPKRRRASFTFAMNIPNRSRPAVGDSRAPRNSSFAARMRCSSAGSFPISVFVSPGGYICGEQSALIEAMSDRRGEPRNMPPKLETNGLEDRPTLVSNVETFAWVPYIFSTAARPTPTQGVNGWKGRRFFQFPAM